MRHLRLLLAAAALLPSACQQARPDAWITYRCADGRLVEASYVDSGHAVLRIGGRPYRLAIARSASGARYVGDGWQWWTRGMRQADLAPLPSGQEIASAPGMACQAR
jgi:membrane-bound inhibitor of C-type lysozyme